MISENVSLILQSISLVIFTLALIITFFVYFELFISLFIFRILRDDDKTKKLITESIYFFAKELQLERTPNILIEAEYPKRPTFLHGYMSPEEPIDDVEQYKVVVYLNRNIPSIIRTVAHEMIHVKQFNKKELKYIGNKISWKGRICREDMDYAERPWEIEAFGADKDLSSKFLKHKNIKTPLFSKIYNYILLDLFSI